MARKRTTETVEKKNGRPRIDIDLNLLKNLAALGCSIEETAQMLRNSGLQVDAKTIQRRLKEEPYRDAMEQGVATRNFKLRSTMVKQSMLMNSAGVQMSIYLSKNFLGMTDKSSLELMGKDGGPIETRDTSARETIASRIARIAARQRADGDPAGPDGK